jgi:hypothetical protein
MRQADGDRRSEQNIIAEILYSICQRGFLRKKIGRIYVHIWGSKRKGDFFLGGG